MLMNKRIAVGLLPTTSSSFSSTPMNFLSPSVPQELEVNMTHIESRPSKKNRGEEYDFFVDCECTEKQREELVAKLRTCATSVNVLSRTPQKDEGKGGECFGHERVVCTRLELIPFPGILHREDSF